MTTAIPADVMDVAIDLVGHCPVSMKLPEIYAFRDDIARAILAERERCAKIAEMPSAFESRAAARRAEVIAAAIRSKAQ